MATTPDGFEPFAYSSAFLDAVGPLYQGARSDGSLLLGLRIEERHCNRRGFAHGGLLVTLADLVLGLGSDLPGSTIRYTLLTEQDLALTASPLIADARAKAGVLL